MIANSDSDAELDRLFELLRARERAGRFRDLPIRHLAQLVTTFADADVFLRTPVPFHGDVEWPVDEKLDTSLALGEPHTEALLTDALEAGLPPDHRLIAGCISSFSRKVDVRLRVDYQSVSRGLNRSSALPVVVNGCGATLYEDYGALFTVGDGRWLTSRLAGMLSFTDATMECYPTGAWTSRLRWRPSRFDPLVWTRDGERAAWLERQHGPVRSLYGQDYLFRQPMMTRWVCRNACWPESVDEGVRRQTQFSVDRLDG